MELQVGTRLLRGRYEIAAGPTSGATGAQSWAAITDYGLSFLVKTWSYEGTEPDRVQRALWDSELRTLYKVGSSPGAEETLVVLRDAGVDREARCFVMVLEAPGYEPLDQTLARRHELPWLSNRDTRARRDLWTALGALGAGLELLHSQKIIHRDVGAESVLFSSIDGVESLRLSGFEWSLLLGRPANDDPPIGWSTPPEFLGGMNGWRPDDDWFGFGMLCARLLLDVERYGTNPLVDRHTRVLRTVDESTQRLTELERTLIGRLIHHDPLERIMRGYEIAEAINDIVAFLSRPAILRSDERPYTLIVSLRSTAFVDELMDSGLREDLQLGPLGTFSPTDPRHAAAARMFIQRDMQNALLYAVENERFFILVGKRLVLRIAAFERQGTNPSWNMAFCRGIGQLRKSEGGTGRTDMPRGRIAVRSLDQVQRDRSIAQASAQWDDVLPYIQKGRQLAQDLNRFHEFVRATNQIELLLLDAEIFPYDVIAGPEVENGKESLTIRERERESGRQVLPFFEIEKGLIEFLQRQQMQFREGREDDSGNIILSSIDVDTLELPRGGRDNQWRVRSVDLMQETAVLERSAVDSERPSAPDPGILRSAGMPGATRLLRRRKQAIDALDSHSYLLRSLVAPGQVYMDTGSGDLPVRLDPDKVDLSKRASIEDILRVRPIYTLQGPPGTGKTTLVAWLLREILEEDPVAQILVTAQAHGAVDVLRTRVANEAFGGIDPARQPLAVRLGARGTPTLDDPEDSVRDVALRVLRVTQDALVTRQTRTSLQDAWLKDVKGMLGDIERHEVTASGALDFVELVKRGANLTYCTTSAGELEALAVDQAFDWSIVEEAGKAHGFDLALPLQAGHRWLLIGDHKQLPPYRFEDYRDGLDNLDEVVAALESLPSRASYLLDWEWTSSWQDRTVEEKSEFREYARSWLKSFQQMFENCSVAVEGGDAGVFLTGEESKGAAASMLDGQHRMHPDIGSLISDTYYGGGLNNLTKDADGSPMARVVHGFVRPQELINRSVTWIDVPWCRSDPRTCELGPFQGKPRFTNPAEAHALAAFLQALEKGDHADSDLAVLAPYTQQAFLLRNVMAGITLPRGLFFKKSLNTPGHIRSTGVHTVDSFQGNQAACVAVSLVRNNEQPPEHGMGFLDDANRINVLLSRAEQLLVLVGSWEFFNHQVSTVEIDDEANPLWHWKRLVTTLEEWFQNGRAVHLDAALGDFK